MVARKKITLVFGTRPEAIKMCPLALELERRQGAEVTVCLTGQHRELLLSVMREFGVKADVNMDVMRGAQSPSAVIGRVMMEMENVLDRIHPDVVVVHGDTATAFAAATASFLCGVRVAHVEAGLRSGDIRAPFPEEFNRRAISLASNFHFAPTERAASNLYEEGIPTTSVFVTGNTVIDALGYTVKSNYSHDLLLRCRGKRIVFLTAHRRESHGETMRGMMRAVRRLCAEFEDIRVIFPVHPNPAVRKIAQAELSDCEGVMLCEHMSVTECHNIMARSHVILTDSGGIQEEAAALGKPVLIMRNVTERQEGIIAGIAKLAGTDAEQIFVTAKQLLTSSELYKKMSLAKNPYGDGHASRRIADILLNS